MLRSSLLFFAALALTACGPTEVTVDGGFASDASTGPAGRIIIESERSLGLTYEEASEIEVRYLEGGSPRGGVTLRFVLDGNANDAMLEDLEVVTGDDGLARTELVAGTVGSAFRVRISAERAPSAYVNVSVSNAGFGAIGVEAPYEGGRAEWSRRVITVYSETECDPPDGYPASRIARVLTLDDPAESDVTFTTLPAGLPYAVVGVVEGSTGEVLASACVDAVEVLADETTDVQLRFADVALMPSGTYETELVLDADAFEAVVMRGIDAGVPAASVGAEAMLEAVEAELRARGFDAIADAFAAERMTGAPADDLDTELAADGADAAEGLRRFFARLLELFGKVRLTGPLALDLDEGAVTATWSVVDLQIGEVGTPDGPAPLPIDPALSGLALAPSVGLTWRPDLDEVKVDSLSLSLPIGVLVSAALEAALADSRSAPGRALRDAAGCGTLISWVADDPTLRPVCDASCADAACSAALSPILDAAQTAMLEEPGLDTVTLAGPLMAIDDDGDLVVDRLDGTLPGSWASGSPMPTTVDATATLTAARTVD